MTKLNQYDALTPKGHEPRGEERRLRTATPGTSLDDVYASRYHLLGVIDHGDTLIAVEATADDHVTPAQAEQVDTVIAEETPPEARTRARHKH